MGEALVRVVSFLWVPQTNIPDAFLISAVYVTCPSPIVVLDLITGIIRLRATFHEFETEKENVQLHNSGHVGTCSDWYELICFD
jgi:hypothetical protein